MLRILALLATLLVPSAAAAGFDDGVDAWLRGDFARAAAEWGPLAESGHAQAANNLARMAELGQDGPVDEAAAARWFRVAAERGHPQAQASLGEYYAERRGGLDDPEAACLWLLLARRAWPEESGGRRYVDFQLARLRPRLSDEQFADVEAQAQAWAPRRD